MEFLYHIIDYAGQIGWLEFSGLVFGLLCVVFLIKENIWTWPFGILYVLVSFVIFWQSRLYGDFVLHIIFLVLNIYGWIEWSRRDQEDKDVLQISSLSIRHRLFYFFLSVVGVILFCNFLQLLPRIFEGMEPPSLPFWDSVTSVLSVTGIWLQTRKKIDSWYYWIAVDILATGIYYYKDLHFYAILYFIYIGLAVSGLINWQRLMNSQR